MSGLLFEHSNELTHQLILNLLNQNEREFVEYVLRNYLDIGEDELDVSKLSTVSKNQ